MYYTRNYHPYRLFNATLGYVYGVIGVPSPNDTVSIPGQRVMANTNNIPVGLVSNFPNNDSCSKKIYQHLHGHWMNTAPFEVDDKRNEIRVDLASCRKREL